MMEQIEKLLAISAELYEHMTEVPEGEVRDAYIDKINELLDERGQIIAEMQQKQPNPLEDYPLTSQLVELDKGIRERLEKVINEIKADLRAIQQSKKSEKQYLNPYGDVRVMDGMYYDGKK